MKYSNEKHPDLEKRHFSFFPTFVKVSLMSVTLVVIGYFKCQFIKQNNQPPKRPEITIPATR